MLRPIGSFVSCSYTDCTSRDENHTSGKLFWITDRTFSNRDGGTPIETPSDPREVSLGIPPSNSTKSNSRRALSLVIWPSKDTVYRFPSPSESSTRIFLAGNGSPLERGVHKLCASHLKAVVVKKRKRSEHERCGNSERTTKDRFFGITALTDFQK